MQNDYKEYIHRLYINAIEHENIFSDLLKSFDSDDIKSKYTDNIRIPFYFYHTDGKLYFITFEYSASISEEEIYDNIIDFVNNFEHHKNKYLDVIEVYKNYIHELYVDACKKAEIPFSENIGIPDFICFMFSWNHLYNGKIYTKMCTYPKTMTENEVFEDLIKHVLDDTNPEKQ